MLRKKKKARIRAIIVRASVNPLMSHDEDARRYNESKSYNDLATARV